MVCMGEQMRLYKYTEKKYLDNFFADGSLRIGTLYSYRDDSSLGRMVSDDMEGIKKAHGHVKHAGPEDVRRNSVLSSLFQGNVTITDCSFEDIRIECPNLYVFCASVEYSKDLHKAWFNQEHYDACYKITAAELFFAAITRVLSKQAIFLGFGAVNYYESDDGIDINSPLANTHPAVLKQWKNFGNQKEVRGVWQPIGSAEITPIVIQVPEAIKYCSIKSILSL